MAVAKDAVAGAASYDTTLSLTVASNSNRVAYVLLVTNAQPTAVTRDGQSFTRIMDWSTYHSLWRLIAPNVGTANISITTGDAVWSKVAWSLYGVDQTTPERGAIQFDYVYGTASVSEVLTTVSGDLCLDGGVGGGGAPTLSVGAGQTQDFQGVGPDNYTYFGSDEAASGTSTTMSWSYGSNLTEWGHVSWVVRAAGGTAQSATTTVATATTTGHAPTVTLGGVSNTTSVATATASAQNAVVNEPDVTYGLIVGQLTWKPTTEAATIFCAAHTQGATFMQSQIEGALQSVAQHTGALQSMAQHTGLLTARPHNVADLSYRADV